MAKKHVTWGFAGPMYWEFQQFDRSDPMKNSLQFLKANGFELASFGLTQIDALDQEKRDYVKGFLADNGMKCFAHVSAKWCAIADGDIQSHADQIGKLLQKHHDLFKDTIVMTITQAGQRFDRTIMPLAQRKQRLVKAMAPLAKICHDLGTPLGVENREDFYCSDLVELCQQIPHLGIFLDTGNTYLIGEKPLPAIREAAPYVIGGHFKDHMVKSRPDNLTFEITGAVLGEGDVPLREAYAAIVKDSQYRDRIMMEYEMISPKGMNPLECLEKSKAFVHSLEAGNS